MPVTKDQHYAVYEQGIKDGKRLISDSQYAGDDLLELATSNMTNRTARQVMNSPLDELIKLVKNYMDGLEDGVKSGVMKESHTYVKWMKDNL